ncbi:EamA family transporter [Solitalea lacus]|uniref:EamA family transporter n=1 Tax=Solitalea lacus TaxID=2911172 RepID=UPI001EDBA1B0|nr:EamA family transporter [Solitalea lacus]UKJ07535.1 EamA family transporter [Solitalea lacus]
MEQKQQYKYFLAGFISPVIWGFFAIVLRNLSLFPAQQILDYRIFTSLAVLVLVILIFRKRQLRADIYHYKENVANKSHLWRIVILSCILLTGNWLSFIYVINNVSVQAGAFAYMVCPLLTAIGAFLILKEPLSKLKWLAIGISLISSAILGWGHLSDVLWSFFVAILFAGYLIAQRSIQGFDKLNLLGIQLLISCVFILPLELLNPHEIPASFNFWINIVIIAVVFTIIPLFLSLFAMIKIPASTAGILIYVNPIIAFAVAYFYFHEGFSLQKLISYSLLAIAVMLFNLEYIKKLLPVMKLEK